MRYTQFTDKQVGDMLGAIGVVQYSAPLDLETLRARFVEQGVWIRPILDIVYLTPAFTISDFELETLFKAMRALLSG